MKGKGHQLQTQLYSTNKEKSSSSFWVEIMSCEDYLCWSEHHCTRHQDNNRNLCEIQINVKDIHCRTSLTSTTASTNSASSIAHSALPSRTIQRFSTHGSNVINQLCPPQYPYSLQHSTFWFVIQILLIFFIGKWEVL